MVKAYAQALYAFFLILGLTWGTMAIVAQNKVLFWVGFGALIPTMVLGIFLILYDHWEK